MGMQLALLRADNPLKGRFRLPPVVPQFNTLTYRLFTAFWLLVFALAKPARLPSNSCELFRGSV
jgi:hypothetical protein